MTNPDKDPRFLKPGSDIMSLSGGFHGLTRAQAPTPNPTTKPLRTLGPVVPEPLRPSTPSNLYVRVCLPGLGKKAEGPLSPQNPKPQTPKPVNP